MIYLSICPSVQPPTHPSIHSFMVLQPFVGPWPIFQFLELFTQSVGLLGRGSARRKAATCTQNSTNIEQTQTNIHASSVIRTHDPNVLSGRRQFMPLTARPLWSTVTTGSSVKYTYVSEKLQWTSIELQGITTRMKSLLWEPQIKH
jgi:hypothetical protein